MKKTSCLVISRKELLNILKHSKNDYEIFCMKKDRNIFP